jgi:hypothetical protein
LGMGQSHAARDPMLSETRETIGDLQRRLMALRGHL